jgi:hypothetical protein
MPRQTNNAPISSSVPDVGLTSVLVTDALVEVGAGDDRHRGGRAI